MNERQKLEQQLRTDATDFRTADGQQMSSVDVDKFVAWVLPVYDQNIVGGGSDHDATVAVYEMYNEHIHEMFD